MSATITVVVVDDSAAYRAGVVDALGAARDIHVLGQGGSAAEAIALAKDLSPDLILLDLEMPGGGIAAARQIAQSQPAIKIFMLTGVSRAESIQEARQAGVHCYLLKGISARALIQLLRDAHQGCQSPACWPADAGLLHTMR
jgi:two-component system, NarL family, nitrate/nitrite response regulator NarL